MATRLYLRELSFSGSGTYPTGEQSTLTAASQMTGVSTIKKATISAGAAQVTISATTQATTSNQAVYCGMWISKPLAAQTLTASIYTETLNVAISESNTNVNIGTWADPNGQIPNVYVWRPSTGSIVGSYGTQHPGATPLNGSVEPNATNSIQVTNAGGNRTGAGTIVQQGDVLVIEVWFQFQQGMGTAYNIQMVYGGSTVTTTDNTVVTNHASYWETSETLLFSAGSISAELSKTLGAVTLTSDIDVAVVAALSKTLGAATLLADATPDPVEASLSKTLGAATLLSDIDVAVVASLSKTLGAATLLADATHPVLGTLSKTLGAATLLSDADVAVVTSLGKTLGTVTLVSEVGGALATISASLGLTLGIATLSADADVLIAASLSKTLGTATLLSAATLTVVASTNRTLGAVTLVAGATHPVAGALSKTLGTLTLLSGVVLPVVATASKTLDAATLLSDVSVISGRVAALDATLGAATLGATAELGPAPEAPVQQDTGAGSGTAYSPRRMFRVPEEAYQDWSLDQLFPLDRKPAVPIRVNMTRTVVLTPMARLLSASTPVPIAGLPPMPKFVILPPSAVVNEDDDDDDIIFLLSAII